MSRREELRRFAREQAKLGKALAKRRTDELCRAHGVKSVREIRMVQFADERGLTAEESGYDLTNVIPLGRA